MAEADGHPSLLERERELGEVDAHLQQAFHGVGRILAVTGPPGIGKSAFLAAVGDRARSMRMRVLRAQCGELERELSFNVVRQLFEPALASGTHAERSHLLGDAAAFAAPAILGPRTSAEVALPIEPAAVLHGLYWLCANLADGQPLLMAVDDAHWADVASVRFLSYVSRRLDGLRLLMLLAHRDLAGGRPTELLASLVMGLDVDAIRLGPLGADSTLALVRMELPRATAEFGQACYQATGGNPLLVRELARGLRLGYVSGGPDEVSSIWVADSRTVARSALVRVGRLGREAVAVARAVAVLGEAASVRHAARVGHIGQRAAARAADALVAVNILAPGHPLRFVHPLVRDALYSDFGSAQRSEAHDRAARLLDAEGASAETVATHLLAREPGADQWIVERLGRAAGEALARGAPETAAAYIRRALEEPPDWRIRGSLRLDLGRAELAAGLPAAVGHLRAAYESATDPAASAAAAQVLAMALAASGQFQEALTRLDSAARALTTVDPDRALELEALLLSYARLTVHTSPLVTARLAGLAGVSPRSGRAGRLLAANRALSLTMEGRSRTDAVSELHRAATCGQDILAIGLDHPAATYVWWAAIGCDELEIADRLIEEPLAAMRAAGSLLGVALALHWRAPLNHRRGRVAEAEADARQVLDVVQSSGWHIALPSTLAWLIHALIERDHLSEAETLIAVDIPESVTDALSYTHLLESRARLKAERGDAAGAASDFELVGRRNDAAGIHNPSMSPWRSELALSRHALGDPAGARELVDTELRLAERFGAPRPVGMARRAAGLVEGGDPGIALLASSIDVLGAPCARLERARALVDLGAALRRSNQRARACQPLREGLALAHACGATALVRRAHDELRACGARPRRPAISGFEALTAQELRVAQYAAAGMSNPQIGQMLFVTRKTVETHLHRIYQKLDIEGRGQVAAALGSPARR